MPRRPLLPTSARNLNGGFAQAKRRRQRGRLRLLEVALWGVVAAVVGYLGFVALDQFVHRSEQAREMREISRAIATSPPGMEPLPAANASAPAMRRPPGHGELIGRLEIPGVGISAFVAAGTETSTLRRGVGHIDGTALPGESGNVGLAGHRDTVFRNLRKLRTADRILLTTTGGSFEYSVESIRTVEPGQVDVLDPSAHPTLTLVTCFPFDFIGPAPMRFIVRAREVSRSAAALPPPREPSSPGAASVDTVRPASGDAR